MQLRGILPYGTATWNDLGTTFQDNPISVSLYAQKNGLLDTPGWKDGKRYVQNPKKPARMINQAKLKSTRTRPIYKYGFLVPRNHAKAIKIDEKFGNTKWVLSRCQEIGNQAADGL